MLACALHLCGIYGEIDNWDPDTSPAKINDFARRHVTLYRELSNLQTDKQLWHVFPKHHLLLHVCEHTLHSRINPKLEWCYGDESEIGAAKRLAIKCHASWLGTQLLEREPTKTEATTITGSHRASNSSNRKKPRTQENMETKKNRNYKYMCLARLSTSAPQRSGVTDSIRYNILYFQLL